MSFTGRTAVVTGGSRGIGRAICLELARRGANVVFSYAGNTAAAEATRKELEALGVQTRAVQGSVADPAAVKTLIDTAVKELGSLDILVNNAGASAFHDFDDYPDKYWEMCINLDFNAVYYLSKEVAHIMKAKGGGKIINIGSALSYTSDAKCPPYTAAKHGVIGITRNFANELGRFNIQTNAICPGFLATEVNAELRKDPAFYNKITNRIAAGRWASWTT